MVEKLCWGGEGVVEDGLSADTVHVPKWHGDAVAILPLCFINNNENSFNSALF